MLDRSAKKRILIVAPHPDDETLGVGGSAAKWVAQGHDVRVLIVSGHLPPLYPPESFETTIREAKAAFAILGLPEPTLLRVPATFVAKEPTHVLNGRIVEVFRGFAPHVVLTCFPDRHVDHRVVFDSVLVATRPVGFGTSIELVAAYETLSETHWNAPFAEPNFMPNWVVDVSDVIERKLDALRCYASQISAFPAPRSVQAVEALAKFRGTQAGFGFGEAFQIIRATS